MATDDNRALKKAMVALYKLYNNVSVAVEIYMFTCLFYHIADRRDIFSDSERLP